MIFKKFPKHCIQIYLKNNYYKNRFHLYKPYSTFEKLSKYEEKLIIKKVEKYNSLVKEGYELKVGIWLTTISSLILVMVCIGGYTRLTESGLSIVDWRFYGRKFPNNKEMWVKEFNKYKMTPEYKQVHYGISLEEYKKLFFNEWIHRMFGRFIGLYCLGSFAFLLYKNSLKKKMIQKICFILSFGAFQGFIGWWMVKSGFNIPDTENKTPRVSPYRLVFHLFCTTSLYSYIFYNSLTLIELGKLRKEFVKSTYNNWKEFLKNELTHKMYEKRNITKKMKCSLFLFSILTLSNILYGGFVAGNDAGYAYNTWPKMLDKYIPDEVRNFYYKKKKKFKQLFENTAIVQFNHRMLSYIIVCYSYLLYLSSKKIILSKKTKRFFILLPVITTAQMFSGISLIIHNIPIYLALVHQFGGFCVLSALLHLLKSCKI